MPNIELVGSGSIAGVPINDGHIEYNLSGIPKGAKEWDRNRDGTCYGCSQGRIHYWAQDETSFVCNLLNPERGLPEGKTCERYSPRVEGFDGQSPRALEEVILQVCGERV